MKNNYKQKGFGLILIIVTILIIAIIAFGFMNRPGQIEKSQEIKNKAINDLQKVNSNLINNNQEIQKNLEDKN